MLRLSLAIALGRLAGFVSRLFGRGGSALPGLVAEAIDPRLVDKLVATISDGVVVITGTNGKTTTTKMLVAALEGAGVAVLTNPTGSNLTRGVATALIGAASRGRIRSHSIAVFEVDEAAARPLAPRLSPRLTVVTNLARDQLDRYGELDTTAAHVGVAVASAGSAVLNADDPAVAGLDEDRSVWFGASADIRRSVPHDRILYGAEGPDAPNVALDAELVEAQPNGAGQRISLRLGGDTVTAELQVPGVYNGYNAAAAVLAATQLGVDPADAMRSLEGMPPAFGRGQSIEYRGRAVMLLLVKNPAGFNQALRLLREAASAPLLIAINDLHADGRDVSWLWDVAFEELAATDHRVGASGIRSADMALRLKYAGVEAWSDTDIGSALDRVVDDAPEGGRVYVVPTYTAMLDILDRLRPEASRAEVWS